ncbi:uncharacterized protein LOC130799315 [Amaranthus tricolor]|uniref:uncharacterized protein LOC130799315 n=1 Tax=Amaranthus tricolor TaxID=29722 RepID=UPI00258D7A1C|nr:uncharacterized protein LOC130799315 [Amaranthus tricolor]
MDITVPEGPSVIHDSIDALRIVQQNMRAAHSRQKSYVGNFRRMLQFEVGDKVQVRFMIPYGFTYERVREVDYELALPSSLAKVHNVLIYVSQLRNLLAYQDFGYSSQGVEEFKDILLVKALWSNHEVKETTCENETNMR